MKWTSFTSYGLHMFSEENEDALNIAYVNHTLFVNRKSVETYLQDGCLYWNEPQEKRYGRIISLNNSRLFAGVYMDKNGVHHFKASDDSVYELTFIDDEQHSTDYELRLGSRMEDGDLIQTMEFSLRDSTVNLAYCHLIEQEGKRGHIHGTLFDGLEGYEPYTFFDLELSDDYIYMQGSAWKDEPASFTEKATMQITGEYVFDDTYEEKKRYYENMAGKAPNCTLTEDQILQLDEETPLYVESLFVLSIPNVENVNTNFSSYLHDLMLYCISDEQLKYLGNPTRPRIGVELTQEMVDFVNANADVRELLTHHYYDACLSSILAQGGLKYSDLITKIDHYDERLNGYYNGHEATSFCNESAYQKLTDRLYGMVYFQNIPGIRPYVKEAKKWASKVHKYALYDEHARLMSDEFSHEIQSRLQHTVILLNYLNPEKCIAMSSFQKCSLCGTKKGKAVEYKISLGSDIYYKLMNRSIMNRAMSDRMNEVDMNAEQRELYYTEAAKQLIHYVYTTVDLSPELEDLKNAIQEAMKQKVIVVPEDYYPYISVVLLEFEAFVAGSTDRSLMKMMDEFYKVHPHIRGGIRVISLILAQGLMIWNSIRAFTDWDNLNDSQKASAILSFSYSVVDIFSSSFDIFSEWKIGKQGITSAAKVSNAGSTVRATSTFGENEVEVCTKTGSNFWEKMAKSSSELSKTMKICGGLLSAFAFSVCVCDIVNDVAIYGHPGWLTAFNVITAITNGIAMIAIIGFSFISTFINTLVGSCVFVSLLPGIGWICTVAGILFSFITYFIRKYATKTLEQKYIEKNCVPFVKSLDIPKTARETQWCFKEDEGGNLCLSLHRFAYE